MIINRWDDTRRDEDNVSINDGEMTYFAEWNDLTDVTEMTLIDLDAAIEDFAETYDHNGEEGGVTVTATYLPTGAHLSREIWPPEEEEEEECEEEYYDDEDDDEDDNE